jgi:hydroxyacid-oxoacid transhydrogenase
MKTTLTKLKSLKRMYNTSIEKNEIGIHMTTSNLKYGHGVTSEIGEDFREFKTQHVLLITDPYLRDLPPVKTVLKSLNDANIKYTIYDEVKIEPTDKSYFHAIDFAKKLKFDAICAVGGGSVIDTAKAVNLYTTYPVDDFYTYVNAPLGKSTPVPGPLKHLIAVPTTAGTGSESTGVAIFDIESLHAKSGIAHRYLKPSLAIVDPENTKTLTKEIAVATGFDVLCHSIESYTAIPFNKRPYPKSPKFRPSYQGSNPISDIWALKALEMTSKNIKKIFQDPTDVEARENMILAASFAAIGFGNAGVHLCHGMSYPVSGMAHQFDYVPKGFPSKEHFVPHGISVVLNAPAVFRFCGTAVPERCLKAAEILGADVKNAKLSEAGEILSNTLAKLMKEVEVPNGLNEIGFTEKHIPDLVKGTMPQHRVTQLMPLKFTEKDLANMFRESMKIW